MTKKEETFLGMDTVVLPDPRDTELLKRLAATLVSERSSTGIITEVVCAILLGAAALWFAYGASQIEIFDLILTPFR